MHKKNELIAYAGDLASYLISKVDGVDKIILHGSIARGDFDEKSDVDLFIDTKKNIKDKIAKILDRYYKSTKFKEWRLKGINNDFSCIVGSLDSSEWKNLKRSIINTGIILYGKYTAEVDKVHHYTLFSFENIKPDKKRVAIHRYLFGFKVGKKRYSGYLEKIRAIKIGKGGLLVPIEYVNEFKSYLRKKRVTPKLYDLWSDSAFVK